MGIIEPGSLSQVPTLFPRVVFGDENIPKALLFGNSEPFLLGPETHFPSGSGYLRCCRGFVFWGFADVTKPSVGFRA